MIKTRSLITLSAIALSLFLTVSALCAPSNPEAYVLKSGGFVDLPVGAYVEGSTRFGGIQPDYKIDEHPDLVKFLEQVKEAANKSPKIKWWQKFTKKNQDLALTQDAKIELVTAMIQSALPHRAYDSQYYLEILEQHRAQGLDISLGSYLQCRSGVCRENALLTHLALKAVGIPNQFVYIHAKTPDRMEDHALVVIEQNGEKWIVDPYNNTFNGKNFDDMMDPAALKKPPTRVANYMPLKIYDPLTIVRINPFPNYWIPKQLCSKVF